MGIDKRKKKEYNESTAIAALRNYFSKTMTMTLACHYH